MSTLLASFILLLTAIVSVSVGVLTAYWILNGLLFAIGHQRREPAPVLAHAGGD